MPDSDPAQPPTHHCPRCRHDLAGLPAITPAADPTTLLTCPECGTPTTIMAASRTPLKGRGWSYFILWVISAVMVLLLLGCVLTILASMVLSAAGSGP